MKPMRKTQPFSVRVERLQFLIVHTIYDNIVANPSKIQYFLKKKGHFSIDFGLTKFLLAFIAGHRVYLALF